MLLIMSAAYVDQELQSEFGSIPPSFLPLGNKRLYEYQVSCAFEGSSTYLVVPESYQLGDYDVLQTQKLNITIVRTNDGISLGAAIVAAINLIDCQIKGQIQIIFGDTLINPVPAGEDIIAISNTEYSYNWTVISLQGLKWLENVEHGLSSEEQLAVCGYFNFSNVKELVKCIVKSNWDFIESLNLYKNTNGIQAKKISNWLDFGHVNSYYRSKAQFTTQRAFNELTITPEYVEKSSENSIKIAAEANWFESIPNDLNMFIPQYLGSKKGEDKVSYRLEYMYLSSLNELYVFAELPLLVWKSILKNCFSFIDKCIEHSPVDQSLGWKLSEMLQDKTKKRLQMFCRDNEISDVKKFQFNGNGSYSIRQIFEDTMNRLPKNLTTTVVHGDFCFSNILYDFRANKIRTIDPRGISENGNLTIYGDINYDIAKLSHSILGMYDWIIAGKYNLEFNSSDIKFKIIDSERQLKIQSYFIEKVGANYNISKNELYAMQIMLFLSMLPLHYDDETRQKALLANTFRLYELLMDIES